MFNHAIIMLYSFVHEGQTRTFPYFSGIDVPFNSYNDWDELKIIPSVKEY